MYTTEEKRERHRISALRYYYNHKEKCHKNSKKWQKANPDKMIAKDKRQKQIKRDYINLYKSDKKCCNCSENRSDCLDFHHTRDKKYNVATLMHSSRYSLQTLKNEIEKCILICANCHRKEHFKGYKNENRPNICNPKSKIGFVLYLKAKSKCLECNESTSCCLAFHHLNSNTKINTVDNMARRKGYTLDKIKTEIQKCILLCFNCHRLLHANKLSLPDNIEPIKLDNY